MSHHCHFLAVSLLYCKNFTFWACDMRLHSLCFWEDLSFFLINEFIRNIVLGAKFSLFTSIMLPKKRSFPLKKADRMEITPEISLLDLPDLVLDLILEKLPPEGLCRMASVSTSLRDMCMSDQFWKRHMKEKWGIVMSPTAGREWELFVDSRKDEISSNERKQEGLMAFINNLWAVALIKCSFSNGSKTNIFPPLNSVMARYLAIESGKFWFPAQVYNRENGHVGFMLSCYDAELCYDRKIDTFQARYPTHGRRLCAIETGVTWDRVRAPPVDASPLHLHPSDCLMELQPGDQIEIQWRRNKEFPYGWWYGVVGHLETCDGNASYCRCRDNDNLVLEFRQYARGSRWRTRVLGRKDHREEGDEVDGFYGGIRKLRGKEEISMWNKLWPVHVMD